MKRLAGEDFAALFESFERTAFRLETLDLYIVPEEAQAFDDFLAGRPFDLAWFEPWLTMIRELHDTGRQMQRVRLVADPPTDYQAFELAVTPNNLAAGEDIHLLPASMAGPLELPGYDYWLFDDRLVAVMRFTDGGSFVYAELSDDPAMVDAHRAARDVALQHAVSYADYLAARSPERSPRD
jgi:hypothetical protein